jgi:plasmid stabilization system protein ParE
MDALSIRWLKVALANLDDIATYIAKDDPDAAYRLVSRVKKQHRDCHIIQILAAPGAWRERAN